MGEVVESLSNNITRLNHGSRADSDTCHAHPDITLCTSTHQIHDEWSFLTWKLSSLHTERQLNSASLSSTTLSYQHDLIPDSEIGSLIEAPNVDGVHEILGLSRVLHREAPKAAKSKSYDWHGLNLVACPASLASSSDSKDDQNQQSSVENIWDVENLLDMTNTIRVGLKERFLKATDVATLHIILSTLVSDECIPTSAANLDLISHTRLDKLLGAIVNDDGAASKMHPLFKDITSSAVLLKNKWQRRFLARYFELDEARLREMKEVRLHDMSLIAADQIGQKWYVDKRNPIDELEGNLSFEPGAWWVNLCSAFRDGIVGNATEDVTRGHYGFTALPMVTGVEEIGLDGTVKLIKKGGLRDMYPNLITHVGREIRVLRGHTLLSKLAPLAGVRYDGLYKIIQYGHRLCTTTETYRLELTLERVHGQRDMDMILCIPLPSELDDWELYNRILAEDIRVRKGDAAMQEWKEREEGEEHERENWRSWHDFKRKHSQVVWATPRRLSRATTSTGKPGY
ncbi:hypothetical protein PVAG01_00594 [Phlyctema vagabunda]|uniref:YDG domain-containing protein n=1 Tax=Phlyctema vagabunda TaxID=108571 RepID=A0ABR4PV24_9HELO